MSDKYTIRVSDIGEARTVSETPRELRVYDGRLQQKWEIREYHPNPSVTEEWRDVPNVTTSPPETPHD